MHCRVPRWGAMAPAVSMVVADVTHDTAPTAKPVTQSMHIRFCVQTVAAEASTVTHQVPMYAFTPSLAPCSVAL